MKLAALCAAAITAVTVTWTLAVIGGAFSVGPELSWPDDAMSLIVVTSLVWMLGLVIAVFFGTIGAALGLASFIYLAERSAWLALPRGKRLLIAGASCGLAYPALGWLSQALGDVPPVKLLSYGLGFWPWDIIYRDPYQSWPGMVVITLAPLVGGLAAGSVYETLTRPEPKGLTTPGGGSI